MREMHLSQPETVEFLKADRSRIPSDDLLSAERITSHNPIAHREDTMSSNASKTGAKILVESLERHRVTHLFGIPVAKIDKVFDTLKVFFDRNGSVPARANCGVHRRRNRTTYSRAGVAIATLGSEVNNLATGLATANSEGESDGCAQTSNRQPRVE